MSRTRTAKNRPASHLKVSEPRTRRTPQRGAETALRIGGLAALAGVSADTLRYYERRGLLTPARRRASGYREYAPETAAVVHFIKHAQALGFTLAEVEGLLRLRSVSVERSAGLAVRDVALAKIHDIDEKLRMLGTLRGALTNLVAECDRTCGADSADTHVLECPIITALSGDVRSSAEP